MDPFDALYPARVTAAAAALDALADRLQARGTRLAAGVHGCRWDGAGATAFRSAAADALVRLRAGSEDVTAAAHALRRHALAVADEVAARRAEELDTYREAARRVHDLLHPGHR